MQTGVAYCVPMKTIVLLLAGAWLCGCSSATKTNWRERQLDELGRAAGINSNGLSREQYLAKCEARLQQLGAAHEREQGEQAQARLAQMHAAWEEAEKLDRQEAIRAREQARAEQTVAQVGTPSPVTFAASAPTTHQPTPKPTPTRRAPRQQGFYSGVVAAGGPARLFQDQLRAEQGESDLSQPACFREVPGLTFFASCMASMCCFMLGAAEIVSRPANRMMSFTISIARALVSTPALAWLVARSQVATMAEAAFRSLTLVDFCTQRHLP